VNKALDFFKRKTNKHTQTASVGPCHQSNDHKRHALLHEPTACWHSIV